MENKLVAFVDTEVSLSTGKAVDLGVLLSDGSGVHTKSTRQLLAYAEKAQYLCGHNIIDHDLKYLPEDLSAKKVIDTLFLSPLLFPKRPYHKLVKDEKLLTEQPNDPYNDCIKARELFYDEVSAFGELDSVFKMILFSLLGNNKYFKDFFDYVGFSRRANDLPRLIKEYFGGKLCISAPIEALISEHPAELAYVLSFILHFDPLSLIPPWVHKNFPYIENAFYMLRNNSCGKCEYCIGKLDAKRYLKNIFGFESFRSYGGEPLQENAVNAAVAGKSLLAVFPTGGGKSLTFQLPALIAERCERALTVVISPLQSLMKDQVYNLERKGITSAVTLNGLLSPVERQDAIEKLESGKASILYISPESLRSATTERVLLKRNVTRFVIDEAHCFSAWGQDFRVDYLYIGDYIRELEEKKHSGRKIAVSCFTATAKQKVISDIRAYFNDKLGIDLELFTTAQQRTNLKYEVIYKETDDDKYNTLRTLIESRKCPTIVYVSRTKRTEQLAYRLYSDGFSALPFNGKMESSRKQENQEAFISGKADVIVATSAFGMGVDKPDVGLVVHFDISDSLENYVQEAGRAGRDEDINAECYVLFNESDLDKHFILLNQSKLSISEIQQVWKAVKSFSRGGEEFYCSARELAKQAGWSGDANETDTRVRTALLALENAGYIKRGKNSPRVYADALNVLSFAEAAKIIDSSPRFDEKGREQAKRIVSRLVSAKYQAKAHNADDDTRVDVLSDILGIEKADTIRAISLMREEGILSDSKDMCAYIKRTDTENKSVQSFKRHAALEKHIISLLDSTPRKFHIKEINQSAAENGIKGINVNIIKRVLSYMSGASEVIYESDAYSERVTLALTVERIKLLNRLDERNSLCLFIISFLFSRIIAKSDKAAQETGVFFSEGELISVYNRRFGKSVGSDDVKEALLYLLKTDCLRLEGGFLVLYNALCIKRTELDNKIRFKTDDYKSLDEFYKQRIRQIHIVGEFARLMVENKQRALEFTADYFSLDYRKFISKYFDGDKAHSLDMNITSQKYNELFGTLSEQQKSIIRDKSSQYIVVCAGPGSGKTKTLVHKLASLLLLEDIKHEQLLMVTFSRSASNEFRERLYALIGNAAAFVEIKTFHSFCFDLLGKIGSISESSDVVKTAAMMIENGGVDRSRITKSVLVIDEAQDMDENEFALIESLIRINEDMRVIAVGDDDQNIYSFRGSDAKYFQMLIPKYKASLYQLSVNFRSLRALVSFSDRIAAGITNRLKTEPITSYSSEEGSVRIIRHSCKNMVIPTVDEAAMHDRKSLCIAAATNEEALAIFAELSSRGIPAKLIRSNSGFEVINIAELRFFLKCIEQGCKDSPKIPEKVWVQCREKLAVRYKESAALPTVLDIISLYEKTYQERYFSDFKMFLRESSLEDFYKSQQGVVSVSTVHKTKGMEFESVILMLDNFTLDTDEQRRKLYVAATRAKSELIIHCNNDVFKGFSRYADISFDNTRYPEPEQIMLSLTHRDVALGFFKDKKRTILALLSGQTLTLKGDTLYAEGRDKKVIPAARFSKAFSERFAAFADKGYCFESAQVRFVLSWKPKDEDTEYAVMLPDIILKKGSKKS